MPLFWILKCENLKISMMYCFFGSLLVLSDSYFIYLILISVNVSLIVFIIRYILSMEYVFIFLLFGNPDKAHIELNWMICYEPVLSSHIY